MKPNSLSLILKPSFRLKMCKPGYDEVDKECVLVLFMIDSDRMVKVLMGKIIVKGKVFQIRAKELFVWSPSFKEVPEVVHCSDDESVKNEADINVVDNMLQRRRRE
ncbi:hypothetical protein Tco_0878568 [Tanacetum coccineum]|uniref:RNA-directed DNA polymerase, eukaryota n=1 Tax=Tanacetum coccineum TaxID=301880 RepID=A0ABQ5C171_9ASTR